MIESTEVQCILTICNTCPEISNEIELIEGRGELYPGNCIVGT